MSNKNITYDPVPPYDLDDIEAASGSTQPPAGSAPTNDSDDEPQTANVVELHGERRGRLSQRECCNFAFAYFLTAVIGIIICVSIIAKRL
jgi:hypothetical protein